MLLYEYKVRDALESARSLAGQIKQKCEDGASASELKLDVHVLKVACEQLMRILPAAVGEGALQTRFNWADYWLGQNQPNRILGDLADMVDRDLPALEQRFRDWCADREHYDKELSAGIGELMAERQLDSAVRKAFILLKERLVKNFGLTPNLDGREAVNKVSGVTGISLERSLSPNGNPCGTCWTVSSACFGTFMATRTFTRSGMRQRRFCRW